MYNRNQFNYYQMPINIPSQRTYINPLNGRRNVPFKQILQKAEKSVDTINSIIPLYKKAQPLIEQGKTIFSYVTSFLKKNEQKKELSKEKVEVEIVTDGKDNQKNYDYRTNETKSKPFFI